MKNKNVLEKYSLPAKVKYCISCTISNQRPRITFDSNGICSACNFADYKKNTINWDQREEELRILLDKHRRGNGEYDVLVPCSGGKDAAQLAHKLKYEYDMNPLTVTWAPHIYTTIGFENIQNMMRKKVHPMTKL